ncbi:MAG: YIP1 family protein [Sporomusaceae bacterium]|nr:YIP1 family protein [Sporomusaceae bacterium]
MQSTWEILYDVIFQPREAFRSFQFGAPIALALLIVILAATAPSLLFAKMLTESPEGYFFSFFLFHETLFTFLIWIIGTGLYHLIAELSGGKGKVTALFAALGMAHLPRLVLLPCSVLSYLLSGTLLTLWNMAVAIGIAIWTVYLLYCALISVYQLTRAKAILLLLSPMLAGLLLVLLGSTFLVFWFSQFIGGYL